MDDGFSPQLTSFSYADGSITNGWLSHHRKETPTMVVKPTKIYYPPLIFYMRTYAHRNPTVQNLTVYSLQSHNVHPKTFSNSSKLIEINSALSKNISELFRNIRNVSPLEIFRNTSLSSENLSKYFQDNRNSTASSSLSAVSLCWVLRV